jgi:hypothetical protein
MGPPNNPIKLSVRPVMPLIVCVQRTGLSVHVPTVSDLENGNDAILVDDLVVDPIVALAYPIQIVSAQFFCAHRPRNRR